MRTDRTIRDLLFSCLLLCGMALAAKRPAVAAVYTWDVNNAGGNWNDPNWNGGVSGPVAPGDSAVITNNTPSNWPAGTHNIVINTPINIDQLTFTDNNPPANVIMILRVSQDSTIQTINWFNDVTGSGRSRYQIDAGRTLSVNNLQFTGRFPDPNISNGTLKFIGASASYGYFGGTEQFGSGHVIDFSEPVTMNVNRTGGGASLEGRDHTWVVGNAASNQFWNITGGQLLLEQRAVGAGWNFHKVGANDVDMTGVTIRRALTGDHGSVQQRNLFTTTTGAATAGGEVRIGGYHWQEQTNFNGNNDLQLDRIGSDLTIASGGQVWLQNRNTVNNNDVSLLQVISGKTLHIEGVGTGDLLLDDASSPLSTGRLGVHFAGATLDIDGDLRALGPGTFLNGGASGGTIQVGGNVTVQSQNPTGFATVSSLVGGLTSAADDFDLRNSTLRFDGGGNQSLDWDVNAAALGSEPTLSGGDFSLANFTIGTLHVTNSSNVTLAEGQVIYLSEDLILDAGSTLTVQGLDAEIHILDADMSEYARISGYLQTQLLTDGLGFWITPGVGYSLSLLPIPEPATVTLLGFGALLLQRRRRRLAPAELRARCA